MTAIEVITSKEKRRYWTRAEKTRWVLALNEPDANASDVARRASVSTSLLYRWRQQLAAAYGSPRIRPGDGERPRGGTLILRSQPWDDDDRVRRECSPDDRGSAGRSDAVSRDRRAGEA